MNHSGNNNYPLLRYNKKQKRKKFGRYKDYLQELQYGIKLNQIWWTSLFEQSKANLFYRGYWIRVFVCEEYNQTYVIDMKNHKFYSNKRGYKIAQYLLGHDYARKYFKKIPPVLKEGLKNNLPIHYQNNSHLVRPSEEQIEYELQTDELSRGLGWTYNTWFVYCTQLLNVAQAEIKVNDIHLASDKLESALIVTGNYTKCKNKNNVNVIANSMEASKLFLTIVFYLIECYIKIGNYACSHQLIKLLCDLNFGNPERYKALQPSLLYLANIDFNFNKSVYFINYRFCGMARLIRFWSIIIKPFIAACKNFNYIDSNNSNNYQDYSVELLINHIQKSQHDDEDSNNNNNNHDILYPELEKIIIALHDERDFDNIINVFINYYLPYEIYNEYYLCIAEKIIFYCGYKTNIGVCNAINCRNFIISKKYKEKKNHKFAAGKTRLQCKQCHSLFYCSKYCQKMHWKWQHRFNCSLIDDMLN